MDKILFGFSFQHYFSCYHTIVIGVLLGIIFSSAQAQTYTCAAYQIVSFPAGATVKDCITNQYLGVTATETNTVSMDYLSGYNGYVLGRWYHLLISKYGYSDLVQWLFVPFNEKFTDYAVKRPQVFSFNLQPIVYNQFFQQPCHRDWEPLVDAEVEVRSEPTNAAVYIDDKFVGYTPCKVKLTWENNSQSRKKVRVEKSSYSANYQIIKPFETPVHIVLQPIHNRFGK